MGDVELRELRYFVAVAEERNFTRAARRLGIAQPPLSKAIGRLEAKLGVRLLERSTRQVSVTPAGQVLLEQSRVALEAVAAATRRTQRAAQPTPRLVIALKSGGDGGLLRDIVAAYHTTSPELPQAEAVVCGWGEPAEMLRDGRADAGLLRSPFDGRGLDLEPLLTEPRVVALASGHRLARRQRLRRADLAGEPVPRWPGADEATTAYWTGRDPASMADTWPEPEGEPAPDAGPVVGDIAQLLEAVALGQAVAFLPASVADRYTRADVTYRPVADVSPSTVAVAWPETSRSPAVAAFVQAAIDLTADRQQRLTGLP
jgi:DNA-binding transcriptional LysR family regulator